jgi:arsenite-transporting ATPase
MIGVAARDTEPCGVRALARIGMEIDSGRTVPTTSRLRAVRSTYPTFTARFASLRPARLFQPTEARLLLFGGKGGVGKTTCAAAAALAIAAATAGQVLLLSTDPAHSLGDVLAQRIGDRSRRIRGGPANLRAREIDASRELDRVRVRYAQSIDALFDRLAGGGRSGAVHVDASHDREAMHGLIDLAPPGIDELVAIIDVVERIHDDRVQTLVIDTAPTGHALRLLEMPQLVHEWIKALMSILLKYQPVAGLDDFAPALVALSRGLGRLRALLADGATTSFIVVTRGAALPREETRDLIGQLTRMNVHVPTVLINAVGRGTCRRCRSQTAIEQKHLKAMRRDIPRATAMVIAPAEMPPPIAADTLRRWQHRWMLYRAGAAPRA